MADDEGGGGGGRSDVLFIFIVLLFLIAVWFFTGGPKRVATARSLFLSPPAPFGTSSTIELPSIAMPDGGYYGGGGVPNQNYNGIAEGLSEGQSISLGLKNLITSPYAGKVHLQNGGSHGGVVSQEYVELQADSNNTQRTPITGWKIQSATNKRTAVIYQGIETYQPTLSSSLGSIVMNPGDVAIVSSGRSPVGVSFKENKCTGYLSQFQQFYPDLSQNCPLPLDEATLYGNRDQTTNAACYDYLQGMSSCNTSLNPPSNLPDTCRSFVTSNLTYQGCLQRHMQDSDFKWTSWRVYLGYSEALWRSSHEVLTLLDADGKLVDSIVF